MSIPLPPPITKDSVATGGINLTAIYDRYLAPKHAPGTRKNYRLTLRRWDEFIEHRKTKGARVVDGKVPELSAGCQSCVTTLAPSTAPTLADSSPTLAPSTSASIAANELDDVLMEDWSEWRLHGLVQSAESRFQSDPYCKPANPEATLRKEWDHLRAILRRAGRRETGNPRGLNLIDMVPVVELPDAKTSTKRLLSSAELGKLWEACDTTKWPSTVYSDSGDIWRAVIALGLTYGIGFAEIAKFDSSWIHPAGRAPEDNGIAECPNGWLRFERTKTHRALVLPISREVKQCLEAIYSPNGSLEISKHRATRFGLELSNLCRTAGITGVHFGSFRKTCNDLWNTAPQIPRAEGLGGYGRWILGHKARDVNDASYASVQHHLAKVIDSFPYPWRQA